MATSLMVNHQAFAHLPHAPLAHPSALFPYQGVMNVKARGRWISGPRGRRFLVHRVMYTGFNLPLEVSIPEGRFNPAVADVPTGMFRRLPRPPLSQAVLWSGVEARRNTTPRRLPALTSQFSRQPPRRHEVPLPPLPDEGPRSQDPQDVNFTTGLGVDPASSAAPAVMSFAPGAGERTLLDPDFHTLRRVFDVLRVRGYAVEERPLGDTREARLPGTSVARLVAEVSRSTKVAYLLEKDRLPGEPLDRREPLGSLDVGRRVDEPLGAARGAAALAAGGAGLDARAGGARVHHGCDFRRRDRASLGLLTSSADSCAGRCRRRRTSRRESAA